MMRDAAIDADLDKKGNCQKPHRLFLCLLYENTEFKGFLIQELPKSSHTIEWKVYIHPLSQLEYSILSPDFFVLSREQAARMTAPESG